MSHTQDTHVHEHTTHTKSLSVTPCLSYTYVREYMRMLISVVSKSLCGFVSNQVQYNMESAQYLG